MRRLKPGLGAESSVLPEGAHLGSAEQQYGAVAVYKPLSSLLFCAGGHDPLSGKPPNQTALFEIV